MKTEVIIVKPGKKISVSTISTDPHSAAELKTFRNDHAPAVCLIDMKLFRVFLADKPELFFNSGCKHKDKALGDYNRKTDMMQLIDGSQYRKFAMVSSSINTLFNNTANHNLGLFIFLGVNESILTEARKELVAEPAAVHRRQRNYNDPVLDLLKVDYAKELDDIYVGGSEACTKVKQFIWNASHNDLPVLIMGGTGTGKELVAQAIHALSSRGRKGKQMITVNCASISEHLFESEIFGHVKGAFTDAICDKTGKWELANDSTLFLDEIGDLALHHQVKILRVLDENIIYKVGGTKPIQVNARIIAATNKDLSADINFKKSHFRLDLYHRLARFIIRTPPLNNHPEDIPKIAQQLWKKICKVQSAKLSPEVLTRLEEQYWPANVREMKHFLERVETLYGGKEIEVAHINAVINEEIIKILNPPHMYPDNKMDSPESDVKIIQNIESLLKTARKTKDADKRCFLLAKSQELLNKIIEDQGHAD